MIAAFWGSVALVGWTYVGFPAWLLARARWRPQPLVPDPAAQLPSVTVVIAAHDEAAVIRAKVDDVLASDYPPERLEVVVASDGSTDATVEQASRPGVTVLDLPRVGKAAALDAAVAASSGEVLVFTDANSRLPADAVRQLVAPLADPSVGGVAGDQRYVTSTAGGGERDYWDLDRLMKRAESAAGSVISATGALYAVRRSLVGPVLEGVTDDFFISTGVIDAGFRLVFAEDAVAWEPPASSSGREFERKVRVMTRGLRGVVARRRLLDPRRTGTYAVQLLTHKVLRRLVVVPLLVIAAATPWTWRRGPLFRLLGVGQAAVYGLGALGLAAGDRPIGRTRALRLPAFFCLVNAAALRALWNVLSGRRIDRWETRRSP